MEVQSDRKAAILEAFMKLVSRFGVDKTTMQDVAKEAGISVGVIYKDFENKEALIDAYIKNLIHRVVNEYKLIAQQDKPADQLLHDFMVESFKTVNRISEKDHGFHQLLSSRFTWDFFQKNHDYGERMDQGMNECLKSIMIQGIEEGLFEIDDPKTAARLFLSAFHLYTMKLVLGKKSLQELLPEVEQMYQFIVKAIQRR